MTTPSPPAGWYEDPSGEHTHRYWDGSYWSDRTYDDSTVRRRRFRRRSAPPTAGPPHPSTSGTPPPPHHSSQPARRSRRPPWVVPVAVAVLAALAVAVLVWPRSESTPSVASDPTGVEGGGDLCALQADVAAGGDLPSDFDPSTDDRAKTIARIESVTATLLALAEGVVAAAESGDLPGPAAGGPEPTEVEELVAAWPPLRAAAERGRDDTVRTVQETTGPVVLDASWALPLGFLVLPVEALCATSSGSSDPSPDTATGRIELIGEPTCANELDEVPCTEPHTSLSFTVSAPAETAAGDLSPCWIWLADNSPAELVDEELEHPELGGAFISFGSGSRYDCTVGFRSVRTGPFIGQ